MPTRIMASESRNKGDGYPSSLNDFWTTKDSLALASVVQIMGDRNWLYVSRSMKSIGDQSPEWYTPKKCGLQYSKLIKLVEQTLKKKPISRTDRENIEDQLVKILHDRQLHELQALTEECVNLKSDFESLSNMIDSEDLRLDLEQTDSLADELEIFCTTYLGKEFVNNSADRSSSVLLSSKKLNKSPIKNKGTTLGKEECALSEDKKTGNNVVELQVDHINMVNSTSSQLSSLSSPQFFNPTSTLANAVVHQVTASATSPLSQNYGPKYSEISDLMTSPNLKSKSPVSSVTLSAPTLSKLLEMPPSIPGKLPSLPTALYNSPGIISLSEKVDSSQLPEGKKKEKLETSNMHKNETMWICGLSDKPADVVQTEMLIAEDSLLGNGHSVSGSESQTDVSLPDGDTRLACGEDPDVDSADNVDSLSVPDTEVFSESSSHTTHFSDNNELSLSCSERENTSGLSDSKSVTKHKRKLSPPEKPMAEISFQSTDISGHLTTSAVDDTSAHETIAKEASEIFEINPTSFQNEQEAFFFEVHDEPPKKKLKEYPSSDTVKMEEKVALDEISKKENSPKEERENVFVLPPIEDKQTSSSNNCDKSSSPSSIIRKIFPSYSDSQFTAYVCLDKSDIDKLKNSAEKVEDEEDTKKQKLNLCVENTAKKHGLKKSNLPACNNQNMSTGIQFGASYLQSEKNIESDTTTKCHASADTESRKKSLSTTKESNAVKQSSKLSFLKLSDNTCDSKSSNLKKQEKHPISISSTKKSQEPLKAKVKSSQHSSSGKSVISRGSPSRISEPTNNSRASRSASSSQSPVDESTYNEKKASTDLSLNKAGSFLSPTPPSPDPTTMDSEVSLEDNRQSIEGSLSGYEDSERGSSPGEKSNTNSDLKRKKTHKSEKFINKDVLSHKGRRGGRIACISQDKQSDLKSPSSDSRHSRASKFESKEKSEESFSNVPADNNDFLDKRETRTRTASLSKSEQFTSRAGKRGRRGRGRGRDLQKHKESHEDVKNEDSEEAEKETVFLRSRKSKEREKSSNKGSITDDSLEGENFQKEGDGNSTSPSEESKHAGSEDCFFELSEDSFSEKSIYKESSSYIAEQDETEEREPSTKSEFGDSRSCSPHTTDFKSGSSVSFDKELLNICPLFTTPLPGSCITTPTTSDSSDEFSEESESGLNTGENDSSEKSQNLKRMKQIKRKHKPEYKKWKKSICMIWREVSCHKFAKIFSQKVTEEVAPGYQSVIHRPMDLSLIKRHIDSGIITSTEGFHRDLMLMFNNAIMYNNSDHDVYKMAVEMQRDVMKLIEDYLATQLNVEDKIEAPVVQPSLRAGRHPIKFSKNPR